MIMYNNKFNKLKSLKSNNNNDNNTKCNNIKCKYCNSNKINKCGKQNTIPKCWKTPSLLESLTTYGLCLRSETTKIINKDIDVRL